MKFTTTDACINRFHLRKDITYHITTVSIQLFKEQSRMRTKQTSSEVPPPWSPCKVWPWSPRTINMVSSCKPPGPDSFLRTATISCYAWNTSRFNHQQLSQNRRENFTETESTGPCMLTKWTKEEIKYCLPCWFLPVCFQIATERTGWLRSGESERYVIPKWMSKDLQGEYTTL